MILVTGASGFVGSALVHQLVGQGWSVKAALRSGPVSLPVCVQSVEIGDVGSALDWHKALESVQVVVHAAARVHVMRDTTASPLDEFRRINVAGTLNLARQAAAAGVRRFVFISSVKVNGEATRLERPFTVDDAPEPGDPYGVSKHEAELALKQVAKETGMEVVIIRTPLVYGPGVKANFESMMRWLARGVPLPLGALTHNRRSLVALDNLVDLIMTCLDHPAAANLTFLVSDGEDLSTADLLLRMGLALGKPARLLPVPASVLKLGAALLHKQDVYQRLCGSLQVDISKTRQLLNWKPPLSVNAGLRRAAQGLNQ